MSVVVTAKSGLCTAAGVSIPAGAKTSDVETPLEAQEFYALTGGALGGSWVIKYTDGTETALLATPGHLAALSGEARSKAAVGFGSNAGTMAAAPVTARFPASTFVTNVFEATELDVENKGGHPVAKLYLDTETTAWASASGAVEVGYTPWKNAPVEIKNPSAIPVSASVSNTESIPVRLQGKV